MYSLFVFIFQITSILLIPYVPYVSSAFFLSALTESKEAWGEAKSDRCHLHFISLINSASQGSNQQIWVPSTSEQAPSAAVIPKAQWYAGARHWRWCSSKYECLCVSISPLSYCVGLYILMYICAYGEHSAVETRVFSQSTERCKTIAICMCACAYVWDVFCTFTLYYYMR